VYPPTRRDANTPTIFVVRYLADAGVAGLKNKNRHVSRWIYGFHGKQIQLAILHCFHEMINSNENSDRARQPMAEMETGAPTTKVTGRTVGAAVAALIIWGLTKAGLTVDEGIKVAITTVITFVVGYWVSPASGDRVK
jgi:hypothetical protein